MLVLAIFVLSVLTYFDYSECSQDKNLGDIRKELLNTEVIIWGDKASGLGVYRAEEVLRDWSIAERDEKGRYKKKKAGTSEVFAPYTLKGKSGRIVAIEFAEYISELGEIKRDRSTDVFGDKIRDDSNSKVNPYFDLIVQLEDGKLITTRGYYLTVMGYMIQTVREFDAQKNELARDLNTLIGKSIYKVAYSKVYKQDIDVKEVINKQGRDAYKLRDIPNLTEMKIVNARYLDSEHIVLLKVEFLYERVGVIIYPVDRNPHSIDKDKSLLQRVAEGFLLTMPKISSSAEMEAIKQGSIIQGMSETALAWSMGFPTKESDWGRGGKQLIYGDKFFVYIRDRRVVDWKYLSK